MEYYAIVGMVVFALIAIIGVYYAVKTNTEKSIEPIHQLNVTIAKLTAAVDNMSASLERIDQRVTKHGGEIEQCRRELDEVKERLSRIETMMEIYHQKEGD